MLNAEGAAAATLKAAEAEAEAVRQVYAAIHDGRPTADLLAIKYMETLQVMADGQATKIFLPAESSALLGALGGIREVLSAVNEPGQPRKLAE